MEAARMSGAARGRRGQGVFAMLAFGGAALLAVAFAGQSRVPAQVRVGQVSQVKLTDDDGSQGLFSAGALAPGRSVTRCLRVDYAGPTGAGPVRLYAGDLSGTLLPHLTTRVLVGTGGGFASCTGFIGSVMYNGTLSGLGGGTASAPGVTTGWQPDPGANRTFQITVTVDNTAGQGQSATGTFQWVFLDDVPAPTPTTPAPAVVATPTPTPSAPPAAAPTTTSPAHVAPHPTTPGSPRAQPKKKRTGLASIVPSLPSAQQVAQSVKKLIGDSVVVGTRVVKHGGFPIGWVVALVFFLVVQNRIDSRDPKLALAPVWRESDVAFADVARPGTADPETPEEGGER
jgi:hypothetical protein